MGLCTVPLMEDGPRVTADAVLRVLADLAPSTEQRPSALAIPTEWFRWLSLETVRVFAPEPLIPAETIAIPIDRRLGQALAALDQIRAEQRSVRLGWLFVAGRSKTEEGKQRRVFHPL